VALVPFGGPRENAPEVRGVAHPGRRRVWTDEKLRSDQSAGVSSTRPPPIGVAVATNDCQCLGSRPSRDLPGPSVVGNARRSNDSPLEQRKATAAYALSKRQNMKRRPRRNFRCLPEQEDTPLRAGQRGEGDQPDHVLRRVDLVDEQEPGDGPGRSTCGTRADAAPQDEQTTRPITSKTPADRRTRSRPGE